mgnify:CR=1 FL=1
MRKLLFLVNPNAGQRRVNKSLTDIIGIGGVAVIFIIEWINRGKKKAVTA